MCLHRSGLEVNRPSGENRPPMVGKENAKNGNCSRAEGGTKMQHPPRNPKQGALGAQGQSPRPSVSQLFSGE